MKLTKPLMQSVQYKVTCLTPVHIGTGTKFSQFDSCWRDRRWWLIDLDKVLAASERNQALDLADSMREGKFSWLNWLKANNLQLKDVACYSLQCWKDPGSLYVREAIKDTTQQPYLPGSTIKGALRTATFDQLLAAQPNKLQHFLQPELPTGKKEWFAQKLERAVLGRDPNHDLLRALHVLDSAPLSLAELEIGETLTHTLRNNKFVVKEGSGDYRCFAEWLRPQATTTVTFSYDTYLLAEKNVADKAQTIAQREVGFVDKQRQALWEIAGVCRTRAREQLQAERLFYTDFAAPSQIVKEIDQRLDELGELERNQPTSFLLNIGWGGGWESKTIGAQVRRYDNEFEQLRARYKLGKGPDARSYDESFLADYFPHSRQLAARNSLLMPLGWVRFDVI